jgi:hypothetical protein
MACRNKHCKFAKIFVIFDYRRERTGLKYAIPGQRKIRRDKRKPEKFTGAQGKFIEIIEISIIHRKSYTFLLLPWRANTFYVAGRWRSHPPSLPHHTDKKFS